jgi:hypothetical protein
MPSPNATFTELVTTTLRNHDRELADNVSKHNAVYRRLRDRGKIQTRSGGTTLVVGLDYAENGTYQRFSGYDALNVNASDVMTSAEYNWSQVAIHVTASGRELRMNSGKEAMINLVKSRITNAKRTAANNMSIDLYSTGSLTNQIGGLGAIITAAGTGSVGGIDSGTYTWWANQFQEIPGTNAYTGTTELPSNIVSGMNKLWLKTTRGGDKTDLIVLTHDFYVGYEGSLQQYQRFASPSSAAAGFESLKFKTADVIFDDNSNFSTTGETGYFLNTDYLFLIEHPEARWTQDDQKVPVNQDAVVIPMYWMGQLVCSNRARQGRLIDAS